MALFCQIIFWICFLALGHTYIIYPFLLKMLARNKQNNQLVYTNQADCPKVAIIMSLFNEEKVIEEKLDSILNSDYPSDKMLLYIGSDNSKDKTNEIVESYAAKHANIHFFPFFERQGKPGVINQLAAKASKAHGATDDFIFLVTDANVMLQKHTLFTLVKHFKNPAISIVDANMLNTGMRADGISKSEHQYVSQEVQLKHNESKVWQKMIGPFGGCYVIRSTYFSPVPDKWLVDDFYIAMKVFEKGGSAINDLEATVTEAVSHDIREEYRRKSRISAGNIQNMLTFTNLWFPPFTTLSFAFFSHKILRWFGAFFLIGMLVTSGLLAWQGRSFFQLAFTGQLLGYFGLPMLDWLTRKLNIHVPLLRNITYFLWMNVALLEGFFKYAKGVKSSVWQPPKRV